MSNQSAAERMFSAKIRDAESLSGEDRRRSLKALAKFFQSASEKYIAEGGVLADELKQLLPANDSAPKQVPTRQLDLVHGMTEKAPPRVAAKAKADEKAKKEAEAKPGKESAAAKQSATPRRPAPPRWVPAEIPDADPFSGAGAAESAIAKYASANDAKVIAVRIGASLDANKFDEARADILLKKLKDKSKATLKNLREYMAQGRKTESQDYLDWEKEEEQRKREEWNIASGCAFLPEDYEADTESGRFNKLERFGKDVVPVPLCHIFSVVGLTYNQEDSDSGLVISFPFNGKRKEITLYKEHVQSNATALKAHLGKEGLSIYAPADEFGRFLLFVMDNVKKEIVTFDKPGWHEVGGEDSTLIFVTPTGEIIGADDDENREYRLKQGVGFKLSEPPGDLETWKRVNAAMAKENPHWAIGPILGLVGVVIQAAGMDTCGINLSGHSSYGKTTAQRQAGSCWTHTEDKKKPGLLRTASVTLNAMEGYAEAANGTALLLDELENFEDKKKLGPMIMKITSGQGKGRQGKAGELRRVASWSTFFVMSNEDPARKFIEENGGKWKPGHSARLMDFNCNDGRKIEVARVEAWRSGLERNCGHAGPEFVRRGLAAGVFSDSEALKTRIVQAAAKIAGDNANAVMGRSALIHGAIAVTAKLAAELDVISADHAALVPGALEGFWKLFTESSDAAASDPRAEAVKNLVTALNARRGFDVLPLPAKDVSAADADDDKRQERQFREAVAWFDPQDLTIYVRADKLEELARARISGSAVLKHLDALKALHIERTDRKKCRYVPNVGTVDHYQLRGEVLGFAAEAPESVS